MDKLLVEFMKEERWANAIDTAITKGIDKRELRQLCTADVRVAILSYILDGTYNISVPHVAQIPKDTPGEFRTVYINENLDRIVLSIVNDMLFELCADWVHPNCKSYQKGIGCGKIVQQIAFNLEHSNDEYMGFKADLSKYFDSVPIEFIDEVFDKLEQKFGKSAIIDVARKYYHQDEYIDLDGNLCKKYQSLKQGCALASFLADVLLYDLDEEMSKLDGFYVRYSDDILFIGERREEAEQILRAKLKEKGLVLNPKKFELLTHEMWFKFLGFNIKAKKSGKVLITLSKNRVKSFQKEIMKLTVKQRNITMRKAINNVNRYLYKGEYAWATSVLPIINVEEDILTLNNFVMDCIRACSTKHRRPQDLGGIGVINGDNHSLQRGKGNRVKYYRTHTDKEIDGYKTLDCMRNLILITRPVYDTIVRQL